ncbi:hypothetical protein Psch_03006 [Pelotomaculum schinkii]|uniref:Uncharacterized protein n=1 Tax=Pelotomaculum schinkii TaxID=78350 RepID=A0A4Y7RAH9_9FIRM|nr:hypothetical protein Psch_03006 [Pelotomaculum schinkii]
MVPDLKQELKPVKPSLNILKSFTTGFGCIQPLDICRQSNTNNPLKQQRKWPFIVAKRRPFTWRMPVLALIGKGHKQSDTGPLALGNTGARLHVKGGHGSFFEIL